MRIEQPAPAIGDRLPAQIINPTLSQLHARETRVAFPPTCDSYALRHEHRLLRLALCRARFVGRASRWRPAAISQRAASPPSCG
jgi:hypothetical protein